MRGLNAVLPKFAGLSKGLCLCDNLLIENRFAKSVCVTCLSWDESEIVFQFITKESKKLDPLHPDILSVNNVHERILQYMV